MHGPTFRFRSERWRGAPHGFAIRRKLHPDIRVLQRLGKPLQIVVACNEFHLLHLAGGDQQVELGRALVLLVEIGSADLLKLGTRRRNPLIDILHVQRGQLGGRFGTGLRCGQRQHVIVYGLLALTLLGVDLAQVLGFVARAARQPRRLNVLLGGIQLAAREVHPALCIPQGEQQLCRVEVLHAQAVEVHIVQLRLQRVDGGVGVIGCAIQLLRSVRQGVGNVVPDQRTRRLADRLLKGSHAFIGLSGRNVGLP